ncbi:MULTISPECIES: DUF2589 domain-containing protein [Tenacibaculum]|uniref:DUF2589 domain-containing protein n=2 Tax=Tenacibaculum TaxID=104267 RepID=A0AAE9MR20_9FLAO|nr:MULTISPECIES: DUF2589 domain-containing protein [Tenacibaculum]AZJ33375.1 DUF2589 domain-containing protein [Tenacibaculum mesophilum]KAF9659622.1 DUF2589 domain-containing protein [Tenacibaculum mesophilum]MCG7500349.1 DUF2589 domain-containing protein [Tenacibaculum sp. Mcav3-52]MCO7184584.1 DUF2589 domain-containing protein [Tenacibaculum sp. XPcli2-G]QFS28618.1 DUF2589 domain-containing protein [Tenacibaculum mesophilum]
MPNLVPELNSLDFNVYVGGPLQAAIQAQTAASMATVNFIKEVGFEKSNDPANPDSLRYVDFQYEKSVPNPDYDPDKAVDANNPKFIKSEIEIKVPFLTMLTIPSIRIDEVNIDFNARLSSTETSNVSSEFAASAELGINYKIVNFKASASYKRNTSQGVKVDKTYNLGVKVRAVNDELPEGLSRILNMLEDSIAAVA